MPHTTRMRVFGAVIVTSQVFWLAETWYFGWNMSPQSHAERVCDQIALTTFFAAWLALFVPSLAFLRTINPFQRARWFYIEGDRLGAQTVTAHRTTRLWRALLLAAALWCLEKTLRASGVPSRLSRFLIVRYVVEPSAG